MTGQYGTVQADFCRAQGRLVWARRLEMRLSRRELGEAVGSHRNTIERWEKGEESMSAWMLMRLADFMDCHISRFLPSRDLVWGTAYKELMRELNSKLSQPERQYQGMTRRVDEG